MRDRQPWRPAAGRIMLFLAGSVCSALLAACAAPGPRAAERPGHQASIPGPPESSGSPRADETVSLTPITAAHPATSETLPGALPGGVRLAPPETNGVAPPQISAV